MKTILFLITNSLKDFSRNKLRTILTSLGILIGVSSVVLLLSLGLGLKSYLENQFESLGSNILFVVPGSIGQGASFRPGMFGTVRFDERDLGSLRRLREADAVSGIFAKTVTVSSPGETKTVDVFAATPEVFGALNYEIETGRLFDKSDTDKRSKVVNLGPKIAAELFGSPEKAVGKIVRVNGQGYTVIGVTKAKGGGGLGGPDLDELVFIPYTAAVQFNPGKNFIRLSLKAKEGVPLSELKSAAQRSMLKRYKEDEFTVLEPTDILSTITTIFSVLDAILVAIGAISLVVGGVGIMNIMFVTVSERIKEIGIRRAVGATKRDILLQFLVEATTLSVLGGLSGLGVSFAVVLIIQRFFPAYIDATSVIAAISVSVLVGVVFGVLPAKKASDLSPIEAIRYE